MMIKKKKIHIYVNVHTYLKRNNFCVKSPKNELFFQNFSVYYVYELPNLTQAFGITKHETFHFELIQMW